jgi:hypothetical protein
MNQHVTIRGVNFNLPKLRFDNQVRVAAAGARANGALNRRYFEKFLRDFRDAEIPDDTRAEIQGAVCLVALECGFRDFAREHGLRLISIDGQPVDRLIERAREVCCTRAELDLVSVLSTTPLTANGEFYRRPGRLLRMDFSDGETAYCKSRNSGQEEVSYRLLQTTGQPVRDYKRKGNWIVMHAAEGRDLFEHLVLPGDDTPNMKKDGGQLLSRIIGIAAFDYAFGALD